MKIEQATPAQREAITTDFPEVVALAGPGSGKTATLVARVERLLHEKIEPSEIAVLTFTNAGARELAERFAKIHRPRWTNPEGPIDSKVFRDEPVALGFVGTLHSFALRMLKEHGGAYGYGSRVALISPESAADLLASKATSLKCKTSLKDLLLLKSRGRPPASDRFNLANVVVVSYLDDMKAAGIVDYDVLLMEFDRLLSEEPFAYELSKRFAFLFVDEVQDSAPADWRIYKGLPMRSKFYVGDPDQAIYSFRGGDVAEMLRFARSPSTLVVKLEDNFRSRAEICSAAQRLIEHNRGRLEKATVSVRGPGGVFEILPAAENEGEEIALVAREIRAIHGRDEHPGATSIAILGRTNLIADGFRKTLPALGIPVVELKRSELPKDWSRARAYLELLANPENDALAFFYLIARSEAEGASPKDARVAAHEIRKSAGRKGTSINAYALRFSSIREPENALESLRGEGITRETRAMIAEKFRELPSGSTLIDLVLAIAEVREYVSEGEGEGVRVLTIHGAKGREFDVVFVVGFEDETIPGRAAAIEDEELREKSVEEERRLAYVAITRGRRAVTITSARTRATKWAGIQPRHLSRFATELAH